MGLSRSGRCGGGSRECLALGLDGFRRLLLHGRGLLDGVGNGQIAAQLLLARRQAGVGLLELALHRALLGHRLVRGTHRWCRRRFRHGGRLAHGRVCCGRCRFRSRLRCSRSCLLGCLLQRGGGSGFYRRGLPGQVARLSRLLLHLLGCLPRQLGTRLVDPCQRIRELFTGLMLRLGGRISLLHLLASLFASLSRVLKRLAGSGRVGLRQWLGLSRGLVGLLLLLCGGAGGIRVGVRLGVCLSRWRGLRGLVGRAARFCMGHRRRGGICWRGRHLRGLSHQVAGTFQCLSSRGAGLRGRWRAATDGLFGGFACRLFRLP